MTRLWWLHPRARLHRTRDGGVVFLPDAVATIELDAEAFAARVHSGFLEGLAVEDTGRRIAPEDLQSGLFDKDPFLCAGAICRCAGRTILRTPRNHPSFALMKKTERLSLKAFADQLELRLEPLSADQLRQVIRGLAREVDPAARLAFLDRVRPDLDSEAALESLAKAKSLLLEILQLKDRLAGDMRQPGKHYRSWRDDNGGSKGAYAEYGAEIEALFDRARIVLDIGNYELARDVYRELFAVLALQDGYGFAMHRPESLDLREERARYLRAVLQAAPTQTKAKEFLEAAGWLRDRLWDATDLSLTEPFELVPGEIAGKERILDNVLLLLNRDANRKSDRWLREITRLQNGAQGLEALARGQGERRPRAWVDWLEAVAGENNPGKSLAAAKDALGGIPDGLSLRAVAADHLCLAALAVGEPETATLARWEAYRADPCPRRLLNLWEAAGSLPSRRKWMLRASAYGEKGGEALLPGPCWEGTGREEDALCLEPGDGFNDAASTATTTCARLLGGDWQKALAEAKASSPGDWSCGDVTLGLVVSVLMAWLCEWPAGELPPNLADLFSQVLLEANEREEKEPRTSERLRAALVEAIPTWKHPKESTKLVETLTKLALRQVNAIVEAELRGAYGQAALMAAAVADLHGVRGNTDASEGVFENLLARHNRKVAFKSELNSRRNRNPAGRTELPPTRSNENQSRPEQASDQP